MDDYTFFMTELQKEIREELSHFIRVSGVNRGFLEGEYPADAKESGVAPKRTGICSRLLYGIFAGISTGRSTRRLFVRRVFSPSVSEESTVIFTENGVYFKPLISRTSAKTLHESVLLSVRVLI